eukprot:scaffold115263_cov69-Phaeocystis_antarctica.AAC.6
MTAKCKKKMAGSRTVRNTGVRGEVHGAIPAEAAGAAHRLVQRQGRHDPRIVRTACCLRHHEGRADGPQARGTLRVEDCLVQHRRPPRRGVVGHRAVPRGTELPVVARLPRALLGAGVAAVVEAALRLEEACVQLARGREPRAAVRVELPQDLKERRKHDGHGQQHAE